MSTVEAYEDSLRKHLLPVLGSRAIDTLIYSELAGLVAALACNHPKTRNNILTPLRGVFELAVRDGLISDNPARYLRNRRMQKEAPDPFERVEMEDIVDGFRRNGNDAIRNYFEFAFTTGLRTSELIALRWTDVDVDRRTVASGFSGTFTEDAAEAFGTVLVGRRSLSFRATLKRLADA